MNPLKTLRHLTAALVLIQGTQSSAVPRILATQNDDTVERYNTRDLGQEGELNLHSALPQAAAVESVVVPQMAITNDWLEKLPGDSVKYYSQVESKLRAMKVSEGQLDEYVKRISKYFGFLMYNSKKPVAEQESILFGKDGVLKRVLESSTEFLFCANLNDFQCIEQVPRITPTAGHRVEDPQSKLGEQVTVNDTFLDKMEFYFNEQIFTPEAQYVPEKGVARKLEKLIGEVQSGDDNGIYMALYGIDDIRVVKNESGSTTGSMVGIFNALVDRVKNNVGIYGVFDTEGIHANAPKTTKLLFSYQKPKSQAELDSWIFSPLKNPQTDKSGKITTGVTNMGFQYNVGTQSLIHIINAEARNFEESTARLEKPTPTIMHNKFFIFKNNGKLKVWTGTANIARTCIGTERNSNLSVVVNEDHIGQVYMTEFREMYDYALTEPQETKDRLVGSDNGKYHLGKFKQDKSPNTKRLFKFVGKDEQTDKNEDTYVRIYFSPTDDGEHRAILPMLHSAAKGDKVLISMFGATGIEYVRALQLAEARGVEVRIIVDSPTACGGNAWVGLQGQSNLLENNPYEQVYGSDLVPMSIHSNNKGPGETWKQNHQKIGMLLRKQPNGSYLPEHFTFGSQNWSEGGNDESDENMMVISRINGNIPVGAAFAQQFDWMIKAGDAVKILKAGCKASTATFEAAKIKAQW